MARVEQSGQPGNTVTIGTTTTDTVLIDHGLGFRRPVAAIGTTSYSVSSTQTGTFFTYGGTCSIVLPAPEAGLWFEFAASGAIVSSVSKFTCGTADAFIIAARLGTSAGVATITGAATASDFAAKGGLFLEFVGLSTTKYLCKQWAGGASVASTGTFVPASNA